MAHTIYLKNLNERNALKVVSTISGLKGVSRVTSSILVRGKRSCTVEGEIDEDYLVSHLTSKGYELYTPGENLQNVSETRTNQ